MSNDVFAALSAQVATHVEVNEALREKLAAACDSINQALAQNTIYIAGDNFIVSEGGDDMYVEGHFGADQRIHFVHRFSEDVMYAALDGTGEVYYSEIEIRKMPTEWVRRIVEAQHLEAFIGKLTQKLKESNESTKAMSERLDAVAARPAMQLTNALAAATDRAEFPSVFQTWRKALADVHTNPEGSITHASSMVETACKHILAGTGTDLPNDESLLALYKAVSKVLQLDSDAEANEQMKMFCRSLMGAIQGIGTLRNGFSESHGKMPNNATISSDHARFTVDVSGSLALFLMNRYSAKTGR